MIPVIRSWQHWMFLRTDKAFAFLTWRSWVLAGTKACMARFVMNCFCSHKIYAVFLSTNGPPHLSCTRTWAGGTLLLWWRRYVWSSCLPWSSLNLIKFASPRWLLLDQMLFQALFYRSHRHSSWIHLASCFRPFLFQIWNLKDNCVKYGWELVSCFSYKNVILLSSMLYKII